MSTKRIVILALVVFGTLLYIWRYERGVSSKQLQLEGARLVFENLDPINLSRITIRRGTSSFALRAAGDRSLVPAASLAPERWELDGLPEATLDTRIIAKMLEELVTFRSVNTIAQSELATMDTSKFGFDSPELELEIEWRTGLTEKVLFGKQNPFSGRRYVQLASRQEVYLVDDAGFQAFNKRKFEVRDHRPLEFDETDVEKVVITGDGRESIRLERVDVNEQGVTAPDSEDGENTTSRTHWRFSQGGKSFAADAEIIEELLTDIASLEVKGFVDDAKDLSRFGLRRPLVSGEISFRRAKSDPASVFQFSLGEVPISVLPEPNFGIDEVEREKQKTKGMDLVERTAIFLRVGNRSTIYRIDRSLLTALQRSPEHFRNRTPFQGLNPDALTEITVTRRTPNLERFRLVRERVAGTPAEWKLLVFGEEGEARRPETIVPETISQGKASEWVKALLAFQAVSFLGEEDRRGEELGLANAFLEIEITGARSEKIIVGNMVKAAADSGGRSEEELAKEDEALSPRYGALRVENGEFIPMIVSSADWRELSQSYRFFK